MKLDLQNIPVLRRIRRPWFKLFFTLGYLLFVFLMYRLEFRCLFREILGIPCPGCGMTRALVSVLRLDFGAAFAYHPVVFALPLMYVYFLFEGTLFRRKGVDAAVWSLIGLAFCVHWVRLLVG